MSAADFTMTASFVSEHSNELTAVATVVVSLIVAKLVDRALTRRGQVARARGRGRRAVAGRDTRLRLVRRLDLRR